MIERRRLMQKSGKCGRAIIDGYEVVDLQLTGAAKNLLFATCNVGAEHEYDSGNFYMYGYGSKTYNKNDSIYTGIENPLDPSKDTATVIMGEDWHMPTKSEADALSAQTTYSLTTINGVRGGKFSKIINGVERYVFFPLTGHYFRSNRLTDVDNRGFAWTSTPMTYSGNESAYSISVSESAGGIVNSTREYGQPVRGVRYKDINYNYEYVDLGLPSGLEWAKQNVLAESETDYGQYFKYGYGATNYFEDTSRSTYYSDTTNPLPLSVDTARQVMGELWRMPTSAEYQELIDNTDYTWVENFNGSGVNGGKFTSKTDSSKYIFFPAAGWYENSNPYYVGTHLRLWSSTPQNSLLEGKLAFFLYCNSDGQHAVNYDYRYNGQPVRGVRLPQYDATVSYLQSSGTQYIKTGINGGPNIKIVIDGAFLSSANSFHGAEDSSHKIVIGVYNSKFYLRHGGGKSIENVDTSRHTFSVESGTVTFDGTSYSVNAYSGTAENGEIYLFADNIQGTASSHTRFKLYSAKIYSSGTLVRYFVPVRVGQTGCLYDSVSRTLFENQGSGSFSFG